jgi:glycine C-acetyltransferase
LLDSDAGERLVKKLWSNTKFFKRRLKKLGFDTGKSETPITPIMVGDAARAHEFSKQLFDAGLLALAIGYPTVPEGKARLRTIVTATHKKADLERACEILGRVGHQMGIV